MRPTFILARDHLERAVAILQGDNSAALQLRNIIQRTICLMDEFEEQGPARADNVLDFDEFRRSRRGSA